MTMHHLFVKLHYSWKMSLMWKFMPPSTSQPPMFKVFWWGSAPRMEMVHRGSECTWSAGNFLREWAPKRLDGNSFPEWTSSVHRFRVFCSSSTSTGTPKSGNLFRPCVRNNSRRNGTLAPQVEYRLPRCFNIYFLTTEHSVFVMTWPLLHVGGMVTQSFGSRFQKQTWAVWSWSNKILYLW